MLSQKTIEYHRHQSSFAHTIDLNVKYGVLNRYRHLQFAMTLGTNSWDISTSETLSESFNIENSHCL